MTARTAFFDAYCRCAVRADIGDSCGVGDIAIATLEAMRVDCDRFVAVCSVHIEAAGMSYARAGRNFWLTRNGGTELAFGDCPEPHATVLGVAARCFGPFRLHIAENGLVACPDIAMVLVGR